MEFKAGMESVDFEKINRLLSNFSLGSHFQKKLDRDAESTNLYVQEMLQKLEFLPDDDVYRKVVDEYIENLLKNKDISRTFIHIDMDAFYAHVEEMDNPLLKSQPVAVGSMDMLVTSNYKAREYGVRSGIPGVLALSLCPHLEIVPLRMDRYREVSALIREVFYKFDKNYVSPSLDEGCLDITIFLKENPTLTPLDVASMLQEGIMQATTLTSSMGIAYSPLLGKIASEANKPNGYLYLPPDYNECLKYLSSIPVKKVPGIGKVRQALLDIIGIQFVEDIMDYKYELYFILPDKHKEILFKHALAIPIFPTPNLFKLQKKRTMITKEKNCKELYDENDLKLLMKQLYQYVINELEKENKLAFSLIVKVQDYSFKVSNIIYNLHGYEDIPQIDNEGFVVHQNNDIISQNGDCNQETNSNNSDENKVNEPNTSPKCKKSSKKVKNYQITFKENTEKIWELFEQAVSQFKFVDIRCLGIKLVNLIDNQKNILNEVNITEIKENNN